MTQTYRFVEDVGYATAFLSWWLIPVFFFDRGRWGRRIAGVWFFITGAGWMVLIGLLRAL